MRYIDFLFLKHLRVNCRRGLPLRYPWGAWVFPGGLQRGSFRPCTAMSPPAGPSWSPLPSWAVTAGATVAFAGGFSQEGGPVLVWAQGSSRFLVANHGAVPTEGRGQGQGQGSSLGTPRAQPLCAPCCLQGLWDGPALGARGVLTRSCPRPGVPLAWRPLGSGPPHATPLRGRWESGKPIEQRTC